jgi:hypothetical protein
LAESARIGECSVFAEEVQSTAAVRLSEFFEHAPPKQP